MPAWSPRIRRLGSESRRRRNATTASAPMSPRSRKAVAGDAKPAAKTVEVAPAKEPAAKPAEPKVAEKPATKEDAPRPSSPPGKKATTALARIIGKVAQQYADDAARAVQDLQGAAASPPAPAVPSKPKQ